MGWMAAALTVFVIANLAVMYLWLCQRSLEKSLAPHREINLMPDLSKRVAVGSGDGFGSGTSIAMAPRYGTAAAAAAASAPAISAGIAAMPPSTPVKAKTATKPAAKSASTKSATVKTTAKTSAKTSVKTTVKTSAKAPAVKKAVVKEGAVVKPVAAKASGKVKADKTDDVSLISGVGPILKKKLAGAGVTSLKQISQMSTKRLEALDDELNLGGRCMGEEWIEQAKELVAGKPPRAKIDKAAASKK